LTIVEPDALKMGVELSFVNSNVAIHAKADRRAVDQILLNLLSNAIKYNRPHGQVFIQCEVSGSQVVVSVRDEGMGMTPKQLANLFQRFNRLGAEASSKPGHGLGLVISKGLAQAMGGELTASSVEQQGTTLVLTLQSCEAATGGAQSPVDRSTWPAQVAGRALKVLYVEDDEVNALLMTEVLRFTPDVAVEVAVTGAAGLALAEVMAPDLIFVDMNLPDMSGLDVVRKVRRLRVCRNTRIIGLSADGEDRTRAAASNAGCDEYWLKPLDLRRIPQVLNTVRGRP
jgi:CheY-like chemotaxis protein